MHDSQAVAHVRLSYFSIVVHFLTSARLIVPVVELRPRLGADLDAPVSARVKTQAEGIRHSVEPESKAGPLGPGSPQEF